MREISDEMLMAYADGEVAGDLLARVEAYLAEDPSGRLRLATFTATGRSLANIFDRPMYEPVPKLLIDHVRGFPSGFAQNASSPDAKLKNFDRRRGSPAATTPTWALAASIAAVVAIGASSLWFFNSKPIGSGYDLTASLIGKKVADNALAAALEAVPSGSVVAQTISGETASIKPSFTFLTGKGEYCRQYEIIAAKVSGFSGVACREAGGTWRIESQVTNAARRSTGTAIVPAGRESPASIEAVVDRMIFGDVLGPEDEARAMSGGWREDRR